MFHVNDRDIKFNVSYTRYYTSVLIRARDNDKTWLGGCVYDVALFYFFVDNVLWRYKSNSEDSVMRKRLEI